MTRVHQKPKQVKGSCRPASCWVSGKSVRQLRGQHSVNLLADLRIWGVVLVVSVLGVGAALVPYYLGQRGIAAVVARFPRLRKEHLERVAVLYRNHGSGLLFFSFVPMLGVLLAAGAGIVGVQRSSFAIWVLIGRIVRNSILLVLVDQGLNLFLTR
jgi:membrane protein YqaA with SNARE-associated domain